MCWLRGRLFSPWKEDAAPGWLAKAINYNRFPDILSRQILARSIEYAAHTEVAYHLLEVNFAEMNGHDSSHPASERIGQEVRLHQSFLQESVSQYTGINTQSVSGHLYT